MTERLHPALKQYCRLQGDGGHEVVRKVFLVVWTVPPAVDSPVTKLFKLPQEWMELQTFQFFPVPSSICITSNSPIFPTMFFHPFLPFFLPPLFCVLDRGQHTPSILFMDQQKESYSLCEMFLHYPISLTVWCVGRRELFGCSQHINRGAESCHSSSSAVCQHSWSTEVSRLKHQTETCTLGDHPH